jgi:hypothetical protein
VIPLDQLVPELLLALGAALLLGNLAAYLRLRPRWRAGRPGNAARQPHPPSRVRVLANIAIGLVVSLAALATLVRRA